MDYNILLAHGINHDDCSSFEYLSNDNETLIFVKLKALNEKKI